MIRNAAQTTTAEAGHLMTPAFYRHMALYALLPSLLIAMVRIDHRPIGAKLKWNTAVIAPLLLLALAMTLWQFPAIASTLRNNRIIIKTLNPVSPIFSAIKFAVAEDKNRTIVAAPLDPDARPGPSIAAAPTNRSSRSSLPEKPPAPGTFRWAAIERKTNPELEKRDIVYFNNTSSCGTATATSLPCMFSALPRSGYSHEGGLAQENVLDVLKHAGNEVTWWENNTGDKGVALRITPAIFPLRTTPVSASDNECRDQVMVEALDPWLDAVQGNATLVLHQLGSHGPAYYARYTEEERLFKPDCRTAEFAACTSQEIINAYDNTIVATDRMLAQVIDLLEARSDRLASAMIYMSDHGESLGEKGLYLHGMPYMLAPSEQTHIPFIMWLSDSYSEIFGVTNACLEGRVDETLSHDNMFHTVLGLMDVNAKHYDPALDVTSGCRAPSS
jgi:lipid A ethanolaminephosphotransferase